MKNYNFPQRKLNRHTWYLCLLALLICASPLSAQSGSDITPTLEVPSPVVSPVSATVTVSHWHKWHARHKKHRAATTGTIKVVAAQQTSTSDVTAVASATPTVTPMLQPSTTTLPAPTTIAAKTSPAKPVTMSTPATPMAPLDMTRDAAPAPVVNSSQPIHDAGEMNVTAVIVRELGALLLVLVILLVGANVAKKYFPNVLKGVSNNMATAAAAKQPSSKDALAWMTGSKPAAHPTADVVGRPISDFLGAAADGQPSFKLISSLNLPGSNSSVHLVQAAQRLLVLGTSQSGATTLLTEVPAASRTARSAESDEEAESTEVKDEYQPPVERYVPLEDGLLPIIPKPAAEIEEDDTSDDDIIAFAEILRQKAGLPSIADRSDVLALDGIDARLNATQNRLNDRLEANSNFSASNSSISPATTRRRRATKPTRTDGAE